MSAEILLFTAMKDRPNRIFELRRAAGLSQEQLAERSGMSKMHVSGLERGTRELSLRLMRRLSDALAVTPADLLASVDNPGPVDERERQLLDSYRRADDAQRVIIDRVTDAVIPFRHRDAA